MRLSTALLILATVVLLAHTSAAQTIEPINGGLVVDAAGKKVGSVIGSYVNGNPMAIAVVALQVDGHIFKMNATRTTLTATTTNAGVEFESTDCTGTAYMATDNFNLDVLIPESNTD